MFLSKSGSALGVPVTVARDANHPPDVDDDGDDDDDDDGGGDIDDDC